MFTIQRTFACVPVVSKCWLVTASYARLINLLTFVLLAQALSSNLGALAQTESSGRISAMEIPVFYITNRNPDIQQHKIYFNTERSAKLHYGYCNVVAPVTHLDPSMTNRFEELGWKPQEKLRKPNIAESVISIGEEEFLQKLQDAGKRTSNKKIILFVHGYSCSFEKAMKISVKLALKIGSPVVTFAWASHNNPFAYLKDESNAEWSSSQFAAVLQQLGAKFGNNNIILISHSIGARIVSWALQSPAVISEIPYQHILFCSPDMDTGTFANCARTITKASEDVSVFISCKDIRLRFSKLIHGNNRLGMAGGKLPEIEGIYFTKFPDHSAIGHSIPYDLLADVINNPITTTAHRKLGTR